jgi:hypothetical protein
MKHQIIKPINLPLLKVPFDRTGYVKGFELAAAMLKEIEKRRKASYESQKQ